jgi:Domain of unknown function (DUF4190)/Septum formation
MSVPPPYGPPPYGTPPYGPPPYGPYGPQTYPAYPPYAVKPPTSTWAVVSLVSGIVGGILVSVITGVVALNKTRDGREGGRGMAIAGLVLSGMWVLILAAGALLLYGSHGDSVRPASLAVGDCLAELPQSDRVFTIDTTPCDQPHLGEVFTNITVPDGDFPGDEAIESYQDRCHPALAEYFPPAVDDDSVGLYLLFPTAESWQRGDRTVTCIATSDTPRTGSLRG